MDGGRILEGDRVDVNPVIDRLREWEEEARELCAHRRLLEMLRDARWLMLAVRAETEAEEGKRFETADDLQRYLRGLGCATVRRSGTRRSSDDVQGAAGSLAPA